MPVVPNPEETMDCYRLVRGGEMETSGSQNNGWTPKDSKYDASGAQVGRTRFERALQEGQDSNGVIIREI